MFVINQEIAVLVLILLGSVIFKSRVNFQDNFQDYSEESKSRQKINQKNLIRVSCPNIKEKVLERVLEKNDDIPSDAILIACSGDWIKNILASDHLEDVITNNRTTYFGKLFSFGETCS